MFEKDGHIMQIVRQRAPEIRAATEWGTSS